MAMVNIDTLPNKVKLLLKKLKPGQGFEILTYKRNRGVAIILLDDGTSQVQERGYHEEEWQVAPGELLRLLKGISKREFPRSRKVRFYNLQSEAEIALPRKKI